MVTGSGVRVQWAEQGVLMLNTCLTVRGHSANSHAKKGWEKLTGVRRPHAFPVAQVASWRLPGWPARQAGAAGGLLSFDIFLPQTK